MSKRLNIWFYKGIILIFAILLTGIFAVHPTYAVQKSKKATLVLHRRSGKVIKKRTVRAGTKVKLPGMIPPRGYTFMGWDKTPGTTNPQYTTGQYVTIQSNTHLYAVMFHRSQEENISNRSLRIKQLQALKKYSQIIFVGDSRIVQIKNRVKAEKNIKFIAKIGRVISGLKGSGYKQLYQLVKKKQKSKRPTAIIVNLGVNDLYNRKQYISYYRWMSRRLKNCEFYFMSVNPTNENTMLKVKHYTRRDSSIRYFNKSLKKSLAGTYTYLDSYSYLLQTGYGTDWSFGNRDRGKDDGLHYTRKTSRRIFEYCLDQLINGA